MNEAFINMILDVSVGLTRLVSTVRQQDFELKEILFLIEDGFSYHVMALESTNRTKLLVKCYRSGGFELVEPRFCYNREHICLRQVGPNEWKFFPIEN